MPYTANPELSTHKVAHLPIAGSQLPISYANRDIGSKYLNCMPRTYSQYGTDPVRIIEPRPALNTTDIGITLNSAQEFRGIHSTRVGIQNVLCYVQNNTTYLLGANIGTLQYATGYVGITTYLIGTTNYVVFLENHSSASYIHLYNLTTFVFTSTALGFGTSGDPVFLNGYIFINSNAISAFGAPFQRIYNSAINSPSSFSPSTDFIDTEIYPDPVICLAKHKNHLVAFGTKSIEFFYDGANQLGSPLTRQDSYAIQLGLIDGYTSVIHPYPIITIGDDLYFIGKTPTGTIGIYVIQNFQVKKISDPFLDRLLNSYSTDHVINSISLTGKLFSTIVRGQSCLVLQYSRITAEITNGLSNSNVTQYCFSPQENEWCQWAFTDNVVLDTSITYYIQAIVEFNHNSIWIVKLVDYLSVVTLPTMMLQSNETLVDTRQVYSEVVFPITDFGSQQFKHIKYVDVLGDFNNHTISLEYTTETNLNNYKFTHTLNSDNKGPRRIRNITRARNIGFKIKIGGSTPYLFSGLNVSYNLGST